MRRLHSSFQVDARRGSGASVLPDDQRQLLAIPEVLALQGLPRGGEEEVDEDVSWTSEADERQAEQHRLDKFGRQRIRKTSSEPVQTCFFKSSSGQPVHCPESLQTAGTSFNEFRHEKKKHKLGRKPVSEPVLESTIAS